MSTRLTIDGREVEVEQGATILDAAAKLGIEIPTLCHADGVPPIGSCFLCAVQVEGMPNLLASCAALGEDGMVVSTDSDDIRSARKTALELLLSDHKGDCEAPCTLACPAGLDIPGFIRHVAAGRDRQAVAVVKDRIPLPGALGRICPRYCERVCRRRELEGAVAVCALKRFAADVDYAAEEPYLPPRGEPTGRTVAVVGAGPAGLSAAYYLLAAGHSCTVYDANPDPGGMFRYALPAFRLPKDVVRREVDVIMRMGADFRGDRRLGVDLALEELRANYDAVFVAIGAQAEEPPDCEGGELCLSALGLLRRLSNGEPPHVGDAVAVLGNGNEAVDVARSAVRLGAREVTIIPRSNQSGMSCFGEWLDAAGEEGVKLEASVHTVRIEQIGDDRLRLTCARGSEILTFSVSCVIWAPERRVDTSLAKRLGLATSTRGITADSKTLRTNLAGVFAGGEAISGPSAGVRAVAAGRLAALCIHQYLTSEHVTGEPRCVNVRMGKLSEEEHAAVFRGVPALARVSQPGIEMQRREASFDEIEQGLPAPDAVREAKRCLQCDCLAKDDCKLRLYASEYGAEVGRFRGERRLFERDTSHPDVVYESGKCVLCGLCVRITEQEKEELGMGLRRRGFVTRAGVPFGAALREGLTVSAERCAAICPTGALAPKRRGKTLAEEQQP